MANFWKGFAQTFDIRPAVNAYLKKQAIEDERQRRIDEQQRQQDLYQSIFDRLQSGGANQLEQFPTVENKTVIPETSQPLTFRNMLFNPNQNLSDLNVYNSPSLSNPFPSKEANTPFQIGQSTQSVFKPDSPNTRAQLFMNLPNQIRGDYQKAQNIFNPQPKYTNFLDTNKDIAFDETSNKWRYVSTGQEVNPLDLIKKEKPNYTHHLENNKLIAYNGNSGQWENIQTREAVNPNDYAPKIEVREKRVYDDQLGKWKITADTYTDGKLTKPGIPRYIALTERKNGVPYISKDAQSMFDNYDKERKEIAGQHAMISTIGKTDKSGDKYVTTEDKNVYASTTADLLKQKNNEYIQTVKQSAPPKLLGWYKKVYNAYKGDPNTGEAFLKNFLDAFKSGEFKKTIKIKKNNKVETIVDSGASETGYFKEMYRAIYGSYPDPTVLKNAGNDVEQDGEVVDEGGEE